MIISKNLDVNSKPQFQSTPADEPHIQIERLRELGVKGDEKLWQVEKFKEGEIWI